MGKTPWKKIVSDPDYIGEADFDEGEEKVVTIARVAADVTIQTAEGKSKKSVVYFAENVKPMILNVVRAKAITKVTGSKFIEDWPGKAIQLYVDDNVKAFGETVSAVRVRPTRPVLKQAVICADCGNQIKPAMGKTADFMAAYTRKNYGVPLCADCAQKRANAAKAQDQSEPEESEQVRMDGSNDATDR